jgi:hypothetical protein
LPARNSCVASCKRKTTRIIGAFQGKDNKNPPDPPLKKGGD